MKNITQIVFVLSFFAGSLGLGIWPAFGQAAGSVRVDHDYQAILRDIPLDNACLTATEVRSLRPVRTCIQLERTEESRHPNSEPLPSWSCRAYADVTLAYPRKISVQTCLDVQPSKSAEYSTVGVCINWATSTQTLPRSIDVRVTPILTRDAPDPAARTETITFPDCPKSIFP